MRNNYLLPLICALTALAQTTYAQENKNISVYISGGNVLASGKVKDKALIKNGWNIEAGGYFPLFGSRIKSHSNSTNNRFSLGIEAGVNYSSQNAGGGSSAYNKAFPYQGGTLSPTFGNGTPHANSFQIFAGLKAEWIFGKVNLSPSLLFSYFSLNRKGYTLSGTVVNPDEPTESQDITFMAAHDYTASGVVIKPGIELGYHLSPRISLFAKGALAYGPSIKNNISLWKPQSDDRENSYNYGQFIKGTEISKTTASKWQSASVNIGLRFTIGKQSSRLSMTPATTRQTQGKTFGEKLAQGMAVNKGKNPLYEESTASGQNPMYESNKINGNNPIANNDGIPARQEARGFNSTRNNGDTVDSSNLQARSNAQDFNTTRSNRERGQFLNMDNGNNNSVENDTSKTSISTAQDFNTTRSNRDNRLNTHINSDTNNDRSSSDARKLRTPPTESYNPWEIDDSANGTVMNPLYEEKGTSGTNPMYDPTLRAKPGNPIGGIVIKGGKNPGGQMITMITDNNGEVILNSLEKGNYLFKLSQPERPAKKGINDAGVKFNDESAQRPVDPISAIIVEGGKNPGGSFIILTINSSGQIGFEVLEAGNYKLILTNPVDAKKTPVKNTNESGKKIKEKPTSGLKDTLKTQV